MLQTTEFTRDSREFQGLVLIGVGLLALMTPFGAESTRPEFFVFYRLLLILTAGLCFWSAGRAECPDFSLNFYASVAAILGLLLVSVWLDSGPEGWTLWYQHLLLALFFVGLARYASRQSGIWRTRLLGVLIACALFHLALGISGATEYIDVFVNRNYFATYLLIGFASSFAIVLFGPNQLWRVGAGFSAVILLYGITSTSSRGATLAAVVVVALGLLKHPRRRLALGAGGLVVAALLAGVLLNPSLIRKFTDTGEIDPYNYDRIGIWSSTLRMVAENPLTGVGLARFDDHARRFRFPVEGTIGRYMKRINIAHSEYLQYAAEAGLPVTILIVGLIASFLFGILRSPLTGGAVTAPHVEAAGMLVLAGVGFHALVDNVWTTPVLVAALATLALASSRLTAVRTLPLPFGRLGMAYAATALAVLCIASALVPGLAYYANKTAQWHYDEGRVEAAASTQRLAVALRPNDALMLTNLGVYYQDLYYRTGDLQMLDMAAAWTLRARDANPAYLPARQEYASTILGRLSGDPARDARIHPRLIRVYESILELDPFLPFVMQNLAEAYYRSGQVEKAEARLKAALEIEPNFVGGYLKLADWMESAGRTMESESLREQAAVVVARYADRQRLTEYEAMLLGRPVSVAGVVR